MFIAFAKLKTARVALTLSVFSLLTACTTAPETSTLQAPEIQIQEAVEFRPANPLPPKPILASFDLSYWEELSGLPDRAELIFWTCGTIFLEPVVTQGEWRLVGISEDNRYTPILDIYNDRKGNRVNNGTVYYHFKLFPAD